MQNGGVIVEFNRTRNSTRTFIFGVLCKIISIIGPFLTRTIIIYKLGTDYLGLSSLFTSVLSILNISELGIGTAITFCLYKPVAEDDKTMVRALLSLLRKLYLAIGIIIISVGLLMMPALNVLISGECPADINLYILYLIYLINAASSYLGFAYKGVLLNVYQRGDISNKIETITEILKYVLQIGILLLFENYYWFAAILPFSTILITISTQVVSKSFYPDLYPEGEVPKEIKRIIKNKVIYLSAHSIAGTLTNSVDNIVISSVIGLTAIAVYGNYSYITSSVLSFILIAYRALTPAIGNSLCAESKEKNLKLFNSLQFLCFWTITWCCTCLLCLFQPFITFWIGKENLLNFSVVIMIVLYFYSNATRQLYGTYVGAAGLWNRTLPRQIISAILNLVLDVMLVKKYGIGGIVFASFASNFFVSLPLDVLVTYKDIMNVRVSKGYISLCTRTIVTTLICAVSYIICSHIKIGGLLSLIIRSVICIIVPNLIMYIFYCKSEEFLYMKSHLKGMIKK